MTAATEILNEAAERAHTLGKRRIPVILQDEISECGMACIAMIASHYGKETTLRQLRQRYRVGQDGISLLQIIKIAEQHGFACWPLKLTLDHVKELQTPSILFWNTMHFVVLESTTEHGIHIVDPGVGRRFYSWTDALPLFSGVALEMLPGLQFQPAAAPKQEQPLGFAAIFKRNRQLWRYLLPIALMAIVIHLVSIAAPKLFSLTIDEVVAKNDEDFLALLMYIFGALFLFKTAALWIRTWLDTRLRVFITHNLSTGVVGWLLKLPIAYFERRSPADLLRRAQAVDSAHLQFTAGWLDIVIDGLFGVIFLGLMAVINLKLACISLLLCAAFFVFRYFSLQTVERNQGEAIDAETKRNSVLLESISAIEPMKIYGYESAKLANWANEQADTESAKARVDRTQKMNTVVHTGMSQTQSLLISSLGAYAVLQGESSIGDLFAFVLYKDMFMECMLKVLDHYTQIRLLRVELARSEQILDETPEPLVSDRYQEHAGNPAEPVRSIRIERGWFRYGSFETPMLENIDLQLSGRRKIAIYGPSGCGKSTLLKVLCGFYPLERGVLKINGIALEHFGLAHYRSRIAYVTANDEILTANVTQNITMDDPHFEGARVQQCAEQAGLLDNIRQFSNGFNTLLGRGGVQLSSGQKQRLLIARALYRQPDILFFDEPTSHLDAQSREIIIATIRSLPQLCVVVTHDDAVRQACDTSYLFTERRLEPYTSAA